jgi:hypothetical protein
MNNLSHLASASHPGGDELGDVPLNSYFPDPTVQAMFLLDATMDDLPTAIQLALLNAQTERVCDESYWLAVVDVLTSQQQEN